MKWRLPLLQLLLLPPLWAALPGAPATSNATPVVVAPCRQLVLVLDPRLTAADVDQAWEHGEPRDESPATLELRRCEGNVVDRLALDGPLARLDSKALRGAPVQSLLVTVDLTAPFGSYSGPLTDVIELRDGHLQRAQAVPADGVPTVIRLPATGKAAWRRTLHRGRDELLAVSCFPAKGGFVTRWRRFVATPTGWRVFTREAPGFWESDQPFPSAKDFPVGKTVGR